MRILFIHEINWWSKVVYEIHELPELLSIAGHDVTLIDFPEGKQVTGWRRLIDLQSRTVIPARRAYADGHIEVRTPGRVLPPPFDRLVATVTFLPLLKRTIKEKQPDVIVLYGVPTNGWQTVRLAKTLGIPVVFRALDVSHELRKTIFQKLIHRAERYIYRQATLISANNEALADYCRTNGAHNNEVRVNYPGMDLEALKPAPKNVPLKLALGIGPADKVVMFMGTLYRFAGLDKFLTLIAPTLQSNTSIKVLLLGGGEAQRHLEDLTDSLGIRHQVVFTGFIDYALLAEHMLLADVAINTFPSTLVTNCALPSKVLQYLCCGLPTVATPVEGLRRMIPEGEGVLYRDLDSTFVDAVVHLLHHEEARRSLGLEARRTAETHCSWAQNLSLFVDSIEEAQRLARPR